MQMNKNILALMPVFIFLIIMLIVSYGRKILLPENMVHTA